MRTTPLFLLIPALSLLVPPALLCATNASGIRIELVDAHTSASLRGVHVAGDSVWLSGTDGTVIRSADKGRTWQACPVPAGAAKLDFRAVWAWDSERAVVMSSGPGDQSRLFRTADGCRTWQPGLVNADSRGFWDAMVFAGDEGAILGDPVSGRFVIMYTHDRDLSWTRDESPGLTALSNNEGAFAASNSALFAFPDSSGLLLWFGTGGPQAARVFRRQGGEWVATQVPLANSNSSSGVFSVAFRDSKHGVAVGGDYTKASNPTGTAATTSDGGQSWSPATLPPSGYRSAVAWDPDRSPPSWIAVGSNGADLSADDGKTWSPIDQGAWNALSLPWCVGPHGRVGRILRK